MSVLCSPNFQAPKLPGLKIRRARGEKGEEGTVIIFRDETGSSGSTLARTRFPQLGLKLLQSFKSRPRHDFVPRQITVIKTSLIVYL